MFQRIKIWIRKKLIRKVTFGKWSDLEDIRTNIIKSAGKGENSDVEKHLYSYLSSAICASDWEDFTWENVAENFNFSSIKYSPSKDFPIFHQSERKTKILHPFDTPTKYIWVNLLASAYGWSIEYICNLDIDSAIYLIQEVLYDEQQRREWEWSLSDKSVSYNSQTKKSKHIPYEKPEWMRAMVETEVPKPTKILKSMIPSGIVVRWDDGNVKH